MLRLNFALYTGQTLLKDWWKQVRSHFTEVQEAHNSLCEKLESDKTELKGLITAEENARKSAVLGVSTSVQTEKSERETADNAIRSEISDERTGRTNADNEIRSEISGERTARENGDYALDEKIANEKAAREIADNNLQNGINALERKSHTHENMSVISGITEDDVASWRDKTDYDRQNALLIENLEDVCRAFAVSLAELYGAAGVTLYDGGMDGAVYDNEPLDGGDFDGEDTRTIDCGSFGDSIYALSGSVVDGGVY